MDITLFDLLLIIKDTEKPIILSTGYDKPTYEKYTFRELALDKELLTLDVIGIRSETFDGRPSYIVKLWG